MIERPSRRRLFKTAAATGAALAFSQAVRGAEGIEPVSFIIVSDTHLGRKDSTSAERQWRAAVEELNEAPGRFVLHLGDVVDNGREPQYPIYAEIRKKLNKPIYEIPGNHDPTDLFQKYVSEKVDRHFDEGGIRFLLLNNAHRDSHDGFITAGQIHWLAEQCGEAARNDLKIIICCHVPIHTNRHPDRGWYVKPAEGQTAFYELLKKHSPRILACLHGHFHNGIRGWRDHGETVESLCPSLCYNQNRNLEEHLKKGAADGFFVDELRPGYLLAEVGRGRFTLRYKPLGGNSDATYEASWA